MATDIFVGVICVLAACVAFLSYRWEKSGEKQEHKDTGKDQKR